MNYSWKRLALVSGVVAALVAGAWTIADDNSLTTPDLPKKGRMDVVKCKDYACRAECGETPYIHGVCVDGSDNSAITIECCCCTGENVNNRYFVGG